MASAEGSDPSPAPSASVVNPAHNQSPLGPLYNFYHLSFTLFIFFIKLLSFKHLNLKVMVWLLGLGPW